MFLLITNIYLKIDPFRCLDNGLSDADIVRCALTCNITMSRVFQMTSLNAFVVKHIILCQDNL